MQNSGNRLRAAHIYGKALKRLLAKDYKNAAILIEKACSIDPELKERGYATYYIGMSHYTLGNMNKAKESFSIAHSILYQKIMADRKQNDVDYFIALSHAYIQILTNLGETELAGKIAHGIELIDEKKILH